MVKYLSFPNSSFALRYFLIQKNGKARVWHTPCYYYVHYHLMTFCVEPQNNGFSSPAKLLMTQETNFLFLITYLHMYLWDILSWALKLINPPLNLTIKI